MTVFVEQPLALLGSGHTILSISVWCKGGVPKQKKVKKIYKKNEVGPLDNRPSTKELQYFVKRNYIYIIYVLIDFSCWLLSQLEFLSFVTIWVVEFCHHLIFLGFVRILFVSDFFFFFYHNFSFTKKFSHHKSLSSKKKMLYLKKITINICHHKYFHWIIPTGPIQSKSRHVHLSVCLLSQTAM